MTLNRDTQYLLDTTVSIDLIRRRPAATGLIHQIHRENISAGYSVLTEAELWVGIRTPAFEVAHHVLLEPFRRYPLHSLAARRGAKMWRHLEDERARGESIPG